MKNDYIKREDAIKAINGQFMTGILNDIMAIPAADVVPIGEEYECGYTDGQMAERKALMRSADVVPIRHGKWKETLSTGGYPISLCTVCNKVLPLTALYYRGFNYCPFCGAKMDGDK